MSLRSVRAVSGRLLWRWLPPFAWMGLIYFLSSDHFSAPELRRTWAGWIAAKSVHIGEYAVLGLLWYRAFNGAVASWSRSAAMLSLLAAAGYAILDELHQSWTTERSGSARDVVLDSFGASLSIVATRVSSLVRRVVAWGAPGETGAWTASSAGRSDLPGPDTTRPDTVVSTVAAALTRGLRSRVARGGGLVLGASVLGGGMNLIAVVLTIRHLSPEAFGALAVALTTMQLVGALANVGLNETLMTMVSRAEAAKRPDEVTRVLSAVLRVRVTVTAAVVAGGVLLCRLVSDSVFGRPDLGFPLLLAIVGAGGVSLAQFGLATLRAFRALGWYATVAIVRNALVLGAVALLIATGRLDLTAALVVNVAAPFLVFGLSVPFGSLGALRGSGRPLDLLPRIWDFSKWVVVFNLCSMFFSRLEIYLLTALASPVELGIYSAAFKLAGGINMVEATVRTVLFPEVARRGASPALASAVRRYVGALAVLGGLVCVACVLASPLIVPILGERYAAAVPIFLIEVISHFVRVISLSVRLFANLLALGQLAGR